MRDPAAVDARNCEEGEVYSKDQLLEMALSYLDPYWCGQKLIDDIKKELAR